MPQSKSQTSPRLRGTFLAVESLSQCVTGGSNDVIAERAGIPWGQVVNHLSYELLFFLDG